MMMDVRILEVIKEKTQLAKNELMPDDLNRATSFQRAKIAKDRILVDSGKEKLNNSGTQCPP
jgi:hypothetical protein